MAPELARVALKYFDTLADIKWWAVRIHQLSGDAAANEPSPSMVVVDDLELFLDATFRINGVPEAPVETVQRAFMHLMAVMRSATDFIRQRTGRPCPLMVCLSTDGRWYNELRSIMERELPITFEVELATSAVRMNAFAPSPPPSTEAAPAHALGMRAGGSTWVVSEKQPAEHVRRASGAERLAKRRYWWDSNLQCWVMDDGRQKPVDYAENGNVGGDGKANYDDGPNLDGLESGQKAEWRLTEEDAGYRRTDVEITGGAGGEGSVLPARTMLSTSMHDGAVCEARRSQAHEARHHRQPQLRYEQSSCVG